MNTTLIKLGFFVHGIPNHGQIGKLRFNFGRVGWPPKDSSIIGIMLTWDHKVFFKFTSDYLWLRALRKYKTRERKAREQAKREG